MNPPEEYAPPLDFGVRGMAAALNITEEEFRAFYRRGTVAPPDSIRDGGPRWTVEGLHEVVMKYRPKDAADQLVWALQAMNALMRAIDAEGY
jgi:hypothetical protein